MQIARCANAHFGVRIEEQRNAHGTNLGVALFKELLERAEPTQREDESNERFDERHNKWKERCDKVYGLAEVIVAKQRHGPIGTRRFKFEGDTTSFSDIALDERLPDHY